MTPYRLGLLLAGLVMLGIPSAQAVQFKDSARSSLQTRPYVDGELIVKYKSGTRRGALNRWRRSLGIRSIRRFSNLGLEHVRLPEGVQVETALAQLREDPDVIYAEPNYLRHACATFPNEIGSALFDNLWGLRNTGQPVNATPGTYGADISATEAWDLGTGSAGLIIAVIDSGVDYNHPDLKDNIWTNTGEIKDNGLDDDGNGYVDDVRGWDFSDDDNDPMDAAYHGTHVAGVIAARGNNRQGTVGVCWQAKIMPLKFLDQYGTGNVADEVAAIQYAIQNGARIINASFGDPEISDTEQTAIKEARSAGLLFIASAGNEGVDIDQSPLYPASYTLDNIISVAASDQNDILAYWSNYGPTSVDVSAPGENIYAPSPGQEIFWSEDFESDISGTWSLSGTWGRDTDQAHSGSYSLADSPGGNYQNSINISAVSPPISLAGKTRCSLMFYLRGGLAAGDKLYVETALSATAPGDQWTNRRVELAYNGGSAVKEEGIADISFPSWGTALVYLYDLDGQGAVYFRFRLQTNAQTTRDGWYIDDVRITAGTDVYGGDPTLFYRFLDGTSAAAPFVSGLSGLLWSRYPDLNCLQIKDLIINNVDIKQSMGGHLLSNGRINAQRSLLAGEGVEPLPLPPLIDSSLSSINNTATSSSGGFCFIGSISR